MREDEVNAVLHSSGSNRRALSNAAESLQFFIRTLSEGKTIVIQANSDDTVGSIHKRIKLMTGIPVIEQRLIYRGKQLQPEQSLADCSIQNDAELQFAGRMQSTQCPEAWQAIDDMMCTICRLCKGESTSSSLKAIKSRMSEFFAMTPKDDTEAAISHLQVFTSSSAPAALVMLYMSPNKGCAGRLIKHFLKSTRKALPENLRTQCAPIVLEFCKLLRKFTPEDTLYFACRRTLASLLENFGGTGLKKTHAMRPTKFGDDIEGLVVIQDIFPFVSELASRLSRDLTSSMEMVLSVGPFLSDVRDFAAFLVPLRQAILGQVGVTCPIALPLPKRRYDHHGDEIEYLRGIFMDLLIKMDKCLGKVEERLNLRGGGDGGINYSGWSQYLTILKELHAISKLYQGTEEKFWTVLRDRKSPLCALILRYAKWGNDHRWILEQKDVINFESRRHLAMVMFPEVKEDYEELHKMCIDRSQLLAESFDYIQRADPEALRGGLFLKFKNEEATGPGVLREWFFLVCQEIFNPQNGFFLACPNDRRRFYPNPACEMDPLHLDYFNFSGRIIALALMHKVQVGVVFDRVFFLQLAGKYLSLEDIQDADPPLYSRCKQILEMDPGFIDSNALRLTFVREVEELGSMKIVELCPGGKTLVVNSKNREEYVNLLIRHQFVTSISVQVYHFAKGFGDILREPSLQKFFFQSLELEDLDWMLIGSECYTC